MKLLMLIDTAGESVCINPAAIKFMKVSDIDRNDTLIYFVDGSHMHIKMPLHSAMTTINTVLV